MSFSTKNLIIKSTLSKPPGSDKAVTLVPPVKMTTLEHMISFIRDDELLEVTPMNLRLRKKYLDSNERKREKKKK